MESKIDPGLAPDAEGYVSHLIGLDYALFRMEQLSWPCVAQLCDFTLVLPIYREPSHCAIRRAA